MGEERRLRSTVALLLPPLLRGHAHGLPPRLQLAALQLSDNGGRAGVRGRQTVPRAPAVVRDAGGERILLRVLPVFTVRCRPPLRRFCLPRFDPWRNRKYSSHRSHLSVTSLSSPILSPPLPRDPRLFGTRDTGLQTSSSTISRRSTPGAGEASPPVSLPTCRRSASPSPRTAKPFARVMLWAWAQAEGSGRRRSCWHSFADSLWILQESRPRGNCKYVCLLVFVEVCGGGGGGV